MVVVAQVVHQHDRVLTHTAPSSARNRDNPQQTVVAVLDAVGLGQILAERHLEHDLTHLADLDGGRVRRLIRVVLPEQKSLQIAGASGLVDLDLLQDLLHGRDPHSRS